MKNFLASFVVFLVALPLSLGIALASGAPIQAGLIAAVIGGLVVGFLGGAPLQVSGPAAGLSVMVLGFVQKFGFEQTCVITVIAGVMQIVLGLLGVGQLTLAISPPVIHAMLAGIGILIMLGQMHVLLGSVPQGSAFANLSAIPESIANMSVGALIVGVLTILVILVWTKWLAKKLPNLPGSLVAVILASVFAYLAFPDIPRVSLSDNFLSQITPTSFTNLDWASLVLSGLALCIVASAESLLCAVATDKLHTGPRADLKRELIAQGIGNSLSGFLGGLPVTGVIVRSSANINAGATNKYSGVLHGLWILIFASFFSGLMNAIPLAVLAGLLIYVGINLVKIHEIKLMNKFDESFIYFATLFGVVFINLLWGIAIGFGLALVMLLRKISRLKFTHTDLGDRWSVKMSGSLSFLSVPQILAELKKVPVGKKVHLEMHIDRLDFASLDAIRSWREAYERAGGKVDKPELDQLWRNLRA